jgi:uncharacterized integral membrane protein
MRYLKFILSMIIIILVIIIIVENNGAFSTKVQFGLDIFSLHYKTPEISIYNIATITFLLGVIITGLYGIVERFQLKKQIKNLYKILKDKDKELNSLRNLPITSDNVVSANIDDIIK